MLQRPAVANAFKSKNGFKILYTQISWGTLSTHREEDKRVRRGEDAAKGSTVIFWRLAGGEEEELLALRVLLFVFVAIFFERKNYCNLGKKFETAKKKPNRCLQGTEVFSILSEQTPQHLCGQQIF